MKKVYANLLGNWIDITTDGLINECEVSLYVREQLQDMCQYDHINVFYNDTTYRIHPSMIQIVTE